MRAARQWTDRYAALHLFSAQTCFCAWLFFNWKYSGCISFRPLPGGRAQRVGKTRHQGSLWAVPAGPPLLPPAVGCLRIGRMEVSVVFFSLRDSIQPRKTFPLQRKCQYSDRIWHDYGIGIITLNPSPSVGRIYLFGAKCDIINISDIWTLCLWLFFKWLFLILAIYACNFLKVNSGKEKKTSGLQKCIFFRMVLLHKVQDKKHKGIVYSI